MTKTELNGFRKQLLHLKQRLHGDVSQLETEALRNSGGGASGGLSSVPIHMADLGSDTFEEDVTLGLIENADSTIEEINGALARIEQGNYGACEECGKPIARERLEALPWTRHCIRCAQRIQAGPTS
jgi:DnaK suppressor protein